MYFCKRCGYDTDIKGNLRNHFRRKRTCKPSLSYIPVETLMVELNSPPPHNYTQPTHKLHTNPKNLHTNYTQTQKIYTQLHTKTHKQHTKVFSCEFCKKAFSRSDSLARHKKNYCLKSKKNNDSDLEFENMKKELAKVKLEKEIMANELDKLIDKVGDTNIQNQQINIHINNFGTENIDYLNEKFVKTLLEMPYKALPKLIKNIHFNPNHPENHNIMITNKKLPFIRIWRDNKWEVHDKHQVLNNMVDKGFNILDDKYQESNHDLELNKKIILEEFQDKYNDNDKILLKHLNKDVELLIINNSDMSKDKK